MNDDMDGLATSSKCICKQGELQREEGSVIRGTRKFVVAIA